MTERQRSVLRMVVKSFIETAGPVGSKYLKKEFALGMSSATIRSTMSDLETMGFLGHPHTSAGRVPTDLGYQAFVGQLMEAAVLEDREKRIMQNELVDALNDTQALIKESSRLLARLAQMLGVVLSPKMDKGVLQRLEIVPVASDSVLFVISVEGGHVRTILMKIESDLKRSQLDRLVPLLNERLVGLTLDEIRRTCVPRIRDLANDDTGVIQLILNRSSDLFTEEPQSRTVQFDGTTYMLSQPEFSKSAPFRDLIEFLDDEPLVVRLMEDDLSHTPGRARIQIGCNTGHRKGEHFLERISIVTAPYIRSNMRGTIGVIGPTRMNYARAVALVEGMATLMSISGSHKNLA